MIKKIAIEKLFLRNIWKMFIQQHPIFSWKKPPGEKNNAEWKKLFLKMPKAIQSDRMRGVVLGKIFVQFYQKTAKCSFESGDASEFFMIIGKFHISCSLNFRVGNFSHSSALA
jgi:hypothetical protein